MVRFGFFNAGEATDEPRVSGSEAAVGPVDGGGVDPHEQFVRLRCGPGDVHNVHDLWGAVAGRDRRLHRPRVPVDRERRQGRWELKGHTGGCSFVGDPDGLRT